MGEQASGDLEVRERAAFRTENQEEAREDEADSRIEGKTSSGKATAGPEEIDEEGEA